MEPPTILHEDATLIAVVKPAGIATANVPAGEESVFTSVKRLLADRGGRGDAFVGVVSRLDRPVSGVVVFAKSPAAAADLARQFRDRTVAKTYLAVVEGRFPAAVGTWVEWIDALQRPHRGPSRRVTPGTAGSVPATLRARVLVRRGEVSLAELAPATGRRHQIRMQLAARGCPIVGDRLYGARLPFSPGIALHARSLALQHPATGRALVVEADPPASWRQRFGRLLDDLPPLGEVDYGSDPAEPPPSGACP